MSTGKLQGRVVPTYKQVKAARMLLSMSQEDLAKASGVGRATIDRFESGKPILPDTLAKISDALDRRGIVFTNGDNPTVSLQPGRAIIPLTE